MVTLPTICRLCSHGCPVFVDVEDDRVVRVAGDRDNPVYEGYTCSKGRSYPQLQHSPARLLRSMKRTGERFAPIPSGAAMDEIAERLRALVDRHGPRSVALYGGTMMKAHPASWPLALAFMDAIGSPMRFTANTIDQPGKAIAKGMLGDWMAPPQAFDEPDVTLLIGINPFVTYNGIPDGHPGRYLRRALDRGMQLVVIDPRRTDIAKRATIHLQPRPGEDIPILAGLLRVVLEEQRYDEDFVAENVTGIEALRQAVAPFTPSVVAEQADVDADDLVRAARIFGDAARGYAVAGTGPNMGTAQGTLFEYLVLALDTVCGHWLRAGEVVRNPGSLVPVVEPKAQARPPRPAYGYGERLRVRGLADSLAGLSTAALADEILMDGPGRIRALLVLGGNPVAAWPDQLKTVAALQSLDLLVTVDPRMSQTARLAHYVIAPKTTLEMPGMTLHRDFARLYANGWGGSTDAYAQYTPAVLDPPAGSDVVEDWELYWGLAERMGALPLRLQGGFGGARFAPVELDRKPTSEQLCEYLTVGSRVPLETVKQHPRGAHFPEPQVVVAPKDDGWEGRLDVGNPEMLADLGAVAQRLGDAGRVAAEAASGRSFRMIARRMSHVYNSSHNEPATHRGRSYNPAFMHPDDLARLGVAPGDRVELASARARVVAIAEPDVDVRPGTVSITHCYGGLPGDDEDVATVGTAIARLLSVDGEFDRYSGQPLMSNVPVAVTRLGDGPGRRAFPEP